MNMIQRSIAPIVIKMAKQYPVVTITGPRQSGKTTLCKMLFPHYSYVNLEEIAVRKFAKDDPSGFVKTWPCPLIIDEIQHCPELLSQIQVESDRNNKNGQYLITGSQQMSLLSSISQSLAGRTAIFTLLPFSLQEQALFTPQATRDECIFAGGMPRVYANNMDIAPYYRDYIRTYIERDLRSLLNVRNLDKFEHFLILLAGRTGQLLNLSSLAGDVGVSSTSLSEWLAVLEASNIIFKLQPWYSNIGKRLSKTAKVYFTDTGIACSLLGLETAAQIFRDPLRGNLFENLVVVEALKKRYNSNSKAHLYFFRTEDGLEIDLLDKRENILIPWEIKSADTMNKEFLTPIVRAQKIIPSLSESSGGIIYSGESMASYHGRQCINFKDIAKIF